MYLRKGLLQLGKRLCYLSVPVPVLAISVTCVGWPRLAALENEAGSDSVIITESCLPSRCKKVVRAPKIQAHRVLGDRCRNIRPLIEM